MVGLAVVNENNVIPAHKSSGDASVCTKEEVHKMSTVVVWLHALKKQAGDPCLMVVIPFTDTR